MEPILKQEEKRRRDIASSRSLAIGEPKAKTELSTAASRAIARACPEMFSPDAANGSERIIYRITKILRINNAAYIIESKGNKVGGIIRVL